MIPHGEGFIIRHQSGRFFQSDSYFPGFAAGTPRDGMPQVVSIYRLVDNPFEADVIRVRQFCGRFLSSPPWNTVAQQFEVVPRPGCGCCGADYLKKGAFRTIRIEGPTFRCLRHADRNPCAIEGCRRTTAAKPRLADDQWLCADHWRQFCPPRSKARRCYHRFFRIAKKTGWTPELEARFTRFWTALVKRARRGKADGWIDQSEIERMFGWAA
jgi:hypothetical protein